MKSILTDLLAIIGVVLNGLPRVLLALTFDLHRFRRRWHSLLVRWAIRLRRVSHHFLPGGDDHHAGTAGKNFGTLYNDF